MSREGALAYLRAHHVMTLATYGPEGVWASAVFYVSQSFDLYFLSAGQTRHGRNIASDARVAATVQENYLDWKEIKGIQLEGTAEKLQGPARDEAIQLYRGKFGFLAAAGAELQAAMARVSWYRLQPSRLYYIDNSRGLGHREQIRLPGTRE